MRIKPTLTLSLAVAVLFALGTSASADITRIQIQLNGTAPTAFAPLAAIFHDGSFNSFDLGQNLSGTGLETLAEVGNPADFLAGAPSSANVGTNGVPTAPGASSTTITIDVDDTNTQFSFASMVLFSNDWFVGTTNAGAIDISALLNGNIGDTQTFDLTNVYDAGTEVEDYTGVGGSAFFPFTTSGALGIDIPNGQATLVDRSTNPFLDFTNVENLDLQGFDPASLDAFTAASLGNLTFTVVAVPEPSSAAILALAGGLAMMRRRK